MEWIYSWIHDRRSTRNSQTWPDWGSSRKNRWRGVWSKNSLQTSW